MLNPPIEPTAADRRAILEQARTVAVLGAHPDPARPAHFVPKYLIEKGYRVLPVNVTKAGECFFGHDAPCALAHLNDLREEVDVVDVFRNSEAVAGHLDEILAMQPPPKVVWMQEGVRNEDVAHKLRERGIVVVQDKCMLAEHRDLGVPELH
ncbi:MAG: CoA-binding protein [Myxococcales bacterium]|nr:CoA-binding protein [Myxococcales bacterium]